MTLEARSPIVFSPPCTLRLHDTFPLCRAPATPIHPDSHPIGSPTPPPMGLTEDTLCLVYERQLGSPVLDIIATIVADEGTPGPPSPPLPPEPPPGLLPPEPPPHPPTPHNSWCVCPLAWRHLTASTAELWPDSRFANLGD